VIGFFFLLDCIFFLAFSLKINFLLKDQEALLFLYRSTGLVREVSPLYLLGAVNIASSEDYLASLFAADYSTSLGIYGREFAKHRGTIPSSFPFLVFLPPSIPYLSRVWGSRELEGGASRDTQPLGNSRPT